MIPSPAPEAPVADPLIPAPFRVASRRRETDDTWTLELEAAGPALGEPVDGFRPGQFAMLSAFGGGEVPISVSAIPDDRLVHTIRAVGTVTEALCSLTDGGIVAVRGPYGTAWPVEQAVGRVVVVVAGGIGLAPLRPVVHALLADRERYGAVTVLLGGRSPHELLYREELERWRDREDLAFEVTVDAADADWRGRVGLVTRLIPGAQLDPANAVAMICGPELMIRFTADALRDRGIGADAIFVSVERSMKCAVGHCGHCQLGPLFACKDGPVVTHRVAGPLMSVREL